MRYFSCHNLLVLVVCGVGKRFNKGKRSGPGKTILLAGLGVRHSYNSAVLQGVAFNEVAVGERSRPPVSPCQNCDLPMGKGQGPAARWGKHREEGLHLL